MIEKAPPCCARASAPGATDVSVMRIDLVLKTLAKQRRNLHGAYLTGPLGGLAGDMFIGALLDAFPDPRPRIFTDLAAVLPASCGLPVLNEGTSGGIAALRFLLVESTSYLHGSDHRLRRAGHSPA